MFIFQDFYKYNKNDESKIASSKKMLKTHETKFASSTKNVFFKYVLKTCFKKRNELHM